MKQEILICVPHTEKAEKELKKEKVFCKCDKRNENKEPKDAKVQSSVCDICNKAFKDERCLKIHKTKMNHWKSASKSTNSSISYSSSNFRDKSNKSSSNESNASNSQSKSQKRKKSNSPKSDCKKKVKQ